MSTIQRKLTVPLYRSVENSCEYLTGQQSRLMAVAPDFPMTTEVYSQLAAKGFRRSGAMVYRPRCDHCTACIPLRIPVKEFAPSRAQRRTLKKNNDLHVSYQPPTYDEEYYALYSRYLKARHGDGSMAQSTANDYFRFLFSPWSHTEFIEFRLCGKLVCVAVTDYLNDAFSSVYTFFDPDFSNRSLGNSSVLWQIQTARSLNLDWLYLGFWIRKCRKMAYKSLYRPAEGYIDGAWRRFGKSENMVS